VFPALELRPVDNTNWQAVARLSVTQEQENYVSSNAWSLLQAAHEQWMKPLAIYVAGSPVGFVLWGRKPSDGQLWLMRLMVDAHAQGHGYGGAALDEMIHRARAEGADVLYLSYVPGNAVAERLYSHRGFVPTGEIVVGELAELEHEPDEVVFCLRLAPGAAS